MDCASFGWQYTGSDSGISAEDVAKFPGWTEEIIQRYLDSGWTLEQLSQYYQEQIENNQ